MADDGDLDNLTEAFAALERSKKRMAAMRRSTADIVVGTGAAPSISKLLLAAERGDPMTDDERQAVMDYLNGLALGLYDGDKHDGLQGDQSDK